MPGRFDYDMAGGFESIEALEAAYGPPDGEETPAERVRRRARRRSALRRFRQRQARNASNAIAVQSTQREGALGSTEAAAITQQDGFDRSSSSSTVPGAPMAQGAGHVRAGVWRSSTEDATVHHEQGVVRSSSTVSGAHMAQGAGNGRVGTSDESGGIVGAGAERGHTAETRPVQSAIGTNKRAYESVAQVEASYALAPRVVESSEERARRMARMRTAVYRFRQHACGETSSRQDDFGNQELLRMEVERAEPDRAEPPDEVCMSAADVDMVSFEEHAGPPRPSVEASVALRARSNVAQVLRLSAESQSVIRAQNRQQHRQARRQALTRTHGQAVFSIEDFVPDVAPHTLGERLSVCEHCNANLWDGETNSMCCVRSNVRLAPLADTPTEMKALWANPAFRRQARSYNSVFAFTSMGVSLSENIRLDNQYANGSRGVYTFRIQGTICHRIGSLLPPSDHNPAFAQIYVHDGDMDAQVAARVGIMDGLDENVVRVIQNVLERIPNPFMEMFVAAGEYARTGHDFRLVIHETRRTSRDPRTHNTPVANEVAAIIVDEYASSERDIVLHARGGGLQRVSDMHSGFDPLHFPILYPAGDPGWSADVVYPDGIIRYGNTRVKLREFYAYRLMTRQNQYSALHLASRLFQQWCVEQYVKIEVQRLRFIRCNQKVLQGDLFRGVYDAMLRDDLTSIGTCVYLPASFTGGERYMRKQYYDSMAIVREFGKPDLFMTVTCNPAWDEIKDALIDGQPAEDRPDLTARVFKLKFDAIKKDIFRDGILGNAVAYVYVVEFQKRGLPHAHVLIKLADEDRPRDTGAYDRFVCAEIPDPHEHRALYDVVTSSMIHGPCGSLNPSAPCMKDGQCSKGFPKSFQQATTTDRRGYPLYRRRDNGRTTIRRGVELDNRWVVPYNPLLCQKYKCHINLEICSTISSVKYVYKYIYKGPDRAVISVAVGEGAGEGRIVNIDEIEQYQSARYISPPEACWRILDFDLQAKSHVVVQLPVHAQDLNWVIFNPVAASYESIERGRHTMLTRFFEICSSDPAAAELLYYEVPKRYTWHRQTNEWKPRQRGGEKTIGRMVSVSPKDVERYHLRLLLCFVKSPKSFEDLRTVDGRVFPTFQEAACVRGLLEDDQEWRRCMQEATVFRMPQTLRYLYVTILTSCSPSDPRLIWDENLHYMSEDFQRDLDCDSTDRRVVYQTLLAIERHLESNGFQLCDYPMLPQLCEFEDLRVLEPVRNPLIDLERSYDTRAMAEIMGGPQLNECQQRIFDKIIGAVNDDHASERLFFVDGPGGTRLNHIH